MNSNRANYPVLADYSVLFVPGTATNVLPRKGGLDETIEEIKAVYRLGVPQVAPLARHLKAQQWPRPVGQFNQSCFNIYHFITQNIAYTHDELGKEEVRTPWRSYRDRETGVDCEDYAILAAALLTNMGYFPRFEIVGFGGKEAYQHIYCVAYDGYGNSCVIDPTPNPGQGPVPFNHRPEGITKKMEINRLEGLGQVPAFSAIFGFGCLAEPTARTRELMGMRSMILAGLSGLSEGEAAREFRKAHYGILLNGMEEQPLYTDVIMHSVHDITDRGNFQFKGTVDFEELGNLVAVHEAWGQRFGYDPETTMAELAPSGVAGLGDLGKIKVGKFVKDKVKLVTSKAKTAVTDPTKLIRETKADVKKAVKDSGKGIKKASRAIVKVLPLTVAARNGLLAAFKLNLFRMSAKLKYGYLSEDQARERGYNIDEWRKLKATVGKVEELAFKTGGEKRNVRSAILKGGNGKALGLSGAGLGDPATGTATAAGAGLIATVTAWLKAVDPKKLFSGAKDAVSLVKEFTQSPEEESADQKRANDSKLSDEWQDQGYQSEGEQRQGKELSNGSKTVEQNPDSGENSNMLIYGGAAVAAVGLILYLKK